MFTTVTDMPHMRGTTTSTEKRGEVTTATGPDRPQRRTRQRTAVAAYLAGADEFRTAQRIHEDLRSSGETLGLATVYRTLQAMAEAGEVDVLRSADGEASYRRCSSTHHHHLICRACGRTEELTGTVVEAWAAQMGATYGFRDVTHDVELSGICGDCTLAARAGR